MNDQKITRMLKNVLFKNYLSDISEAKPYKAEFSKKVYFDDQEIFEEKIDLILIGNLDKWCQLRQMTENLN